MTDPNQDFAKLRKAAEDVVKAYETPPLKTPFLKPAIDRLRAALKGDK